MIAEDGSQVGIVPTEEALKMAKEKGLDLVEVAPDAKPCVCRIMDFNKLQYEKKRKVKESRKKGRQIQIKEVKFRPTIDPHDLETKVKILRKFIARGDKVKLTLMFRGRQIIHPELGEKVILQIIEQVSDIANLEGTIQKQGRLINAFLVASSSPTPSSAKPKVANEEREDLGKKDAEDEDIKEK